MGLTTMMTVIAGLSESRKELYECFRMTSIQTQRPFLRKRSEKPTGLCPSTATQTDIIRYLTVQYVYKKNPRCDE